MAKYWFALVVNLAFEEEVVAVVPFPDIKQKKIISTNSFPEIQSCLYSQALVGVAVPHYQVALLIPYPEKNGFKYISLYIIDV